MCTTTEQLKHSLQWKPTMVVGLAGTERHYSILTDFAAEHRTHTGNSTQPQRVTMLHCHQIRPHCEVKNHAEFIKKKERGVVNACLFAGKCAVRIFYLGTGGPQVTTKVHSLNSDVTRIMVKVKTHSSLNQHK